MAEISGRAVRIVTWNIHGCVGRDGRFDMARTADVLTRLNADVVALQEVDSRHRDAAADTFDYLRDRLGEHGLHATTMTNARGAFGQMLVSRWPIARADIHDLSHPDREPRRALEADVALPVGAVRFLATHLGLGRLERRRQIATLRDMARRDRHRPTVLLGDFNDWRQRGESHRAFSNLFDNWTRHRTFPARLPLLPLDRIWSRPHGLLRRSWTIAAARHASDHLPLAAELDVSTR